MSLHSGIDTVGFVSSGLFTKTFGLTEQANINNLFVSLGLLEGALSATGGFLKKLVRYFKRRGRR